MEKVLSGVRFLDTDASVDGPPPAFICEHTDEILGSLLHLDDWAIGKLRTGGIVPSNKEGRQMAPVTVKYFFP